MLDLPCVQEFKQWPSHFVKPTSLGGATIHELLIFLIAKLIPSEEPVFFQTKKRERRKSNREWLKVYSPCLEIIKRYEKREKLSSLKIMPWKHALLGSTWWLITLYISGGICHLSPSHYFIFWHDFRVDDKGQDDHAVLWHTFVCLMIWHRTGRHKLSAKIISF